MIVAIPVYLVSQILLCSKCASVDSFLISNHPIEIPRRTQPPITRTSISITSSKLHSSSSPSSKSKPQKRQSKKEEYQYQYKINYENSQHHHPTDSKDNKNSGESTFWYSVKSTIPLSQEEVIPYQPTLDNDGPLPYGSYKQLGNEEYQSKPMCILPIALDFWNNECQYNLYNKRNENNDNNNYIDTSSILSNVHQLIDSGFTSFQLHNHQNDHSHPKSNTNTMEPSWKQTFTEQNIYHKIIQDTPSSVLNQCTFSTRIHIPKLMKKGTYQSNYKEDDDSLFTFKEHLVRRCIGQSIKNINGRTNGCIDNIQVNYQFDERYGMSPYTFDTLSVLTDLQREGLVRSISGLNFPPHAMEEIERNGFHLDYNQISCNLLHSTDYTEYLQKGKYSQRNENNQQIVVSSPLAGGLLTNRYSNIPISMLNRKGLPRDEYMSSSEAWSYKRDLVKNWYPIHKDERQNCHPWHLFNNKMMKVLEDIACKHEVSIATVVLRWSIQLDQVGSVVVGSSLNTKYIDSDRDFTRHRDLREVFTLNLVEEDMARLWVASIGYEFNINDEGFDEYVIGEGDEIDFGNSKLWL